MGRTNLRELARKHGITTRPSQTDIEETED
jgi:hypothetical protein